MRMSRATAYAIRALLQLAEAPAEVPVPCSQLARSGEMPERFLLQVLRHLVNHGLLKSTRGVDGGYGLARPAGDISLLHVFEATDGPLVPNLPPLDGMPEASRKQLSSVMHQVTADVSKRLSQVSLTDLAVAKKKDAGTAQTSL